MYSKVSIIMIMILVTAAIVTGQSSVLQVSYAQPNQDMRAVLDIHNRERALVGFPPLTWSDSLAAGAQNWANYLATLGIVCGPQGCQPPAPHGANNENIALGYVYPAEIGRSFCCTPAQYAQRWADEKVKYDAGQRTGPGIGHYTAMVWKTTSEVGCVARNDGHFYELFWSGVNVVRGWDITEQSGAPAVTTYPEWTHKFSAYNSAGTNTKHIVFQNIDGYVKHLNG